MLVSVSSMPAGKDVCQYAKQIESFADFFHCDVCDGQYNQTVCFLPELAKQVNNSSTIPLDCHLMTKSPLLFAKKYIASGANIVTSQIETFGDKAQIEQFVSFVKQNHTLVGLSLEPETPVDAVLPYLIDIDIVLVMSVKTGLSGQKFDDSILPKVEYLAKLRASEKLNYKIEVDGGINDKVAKLVKQAGADIVVSGNFVFFANDRKKAIESLH